MEHLLEFFKNTVAILIAIRIAVVVGMIVLLGRLIFNFVNSSDVKRFWHSRKRGVLRHRNFMKH